MHVEVPCWCLDRWELAESHVSSMGVRRVVTGKDMESCVLAFASRCKYSTPDTNRNSWARRQQGCGTGQRIPVKRIGPTWAFIPESEKWS